MGLDNATVKEFANLINPFDKTSGEATVYGRVVGFNEIGGRPIVNLDGSTQNIPIRTTVKVKGPKGSPGDQDYYAGDRVLVRIKNHEALIVSNISTQMTTAEGAEDAAKQYVSDNGFIYAEKISGEQGDFYTLSADKFTATEITGALGHFITVNADRIITDAINAQIANIDTIKASDVVAGEGDFAYLNVDNVLDAKMANLDTANINRASVNDLLVKGFAIATDATIVNGHITGYLDSVEINANKITAGTLLVDRLYIKDQNNKWKMQTVDGQGHTVYVEAADRINERTITADKLVAHSITTDELNVSNLTAGDSVFMTALTNTLEAEEIFVSYEEADSIIAGKIAADLAELDILNINEELKTQNIHLGEIVFDQPSKPEIVSQDWPSYILGIKPEFKYISAYDNTSLYSEGDYVTFIYPEYDSTKTYEIGDMVIYDSLEFKCKVKIETPEEWDINHWEQTGAETNRVYKCITAITTAEDFDPKKWYYLRDAINGYQYEFDHVVYTDEPILKKLNFINQLDQYYYLQSLKTGEELNPYPYPGYDEKAYHSYYNISLPIFKRRVRSNIHSGYHAEFEQAQISYDKGEFNYGLSSTDDTFDSGVNGISVYNNKGNGKVTLVRGKNLDPQPLDPDAYVLQISFTNCTRNVDISPGYGGFYFGIGESGYNGRVFKFHIYAKIPEGYILCYASNSMGTEYSAEWITDNAGTGEYKWYEFIMQYGNGTVSSTGFFYLDNKPPTSVEVARSVTWYVAVAGYREITGWKYSRTTSINGSTGKKVFDGYANDGYNALDMMHPVGSIIIMDRSACKRDNSKPPIYTVKQNENPNNLFCGLWVRRMGHSGEGSKPLSMVGFLPKGDIGSYETSTPNTYDSCGILNYTGSNSKAISAHSVSASISNAATTLNYNQSGLRSHNHRQYHHCAGGNCSDNLAQGDTYASSFNWNPTNWSFCPDTGNWNAASSHSHANSISVSVGAHSNVNVEQETYTVKVWCRIM